jgi:hypothetical protein
VVSGTPIPIFGQCNLIYEPGPAEDVQVKIQIRNQAGTVRTFNTYTSFGTGQFSITFQPSYNEGGM